MTCFSGKERKAKGAWNIHEIKNRKKTYGIIGLGRFGTALAVHLAESGSEIMVIDASEDSIRKLRDYTQYAFVIKNGLDKETLEATGIQDCDVVVVAIGENIDTRHFGDASFGEHGRKTRHCQGNQCRPR